MRITPSNEKGGLYREGKIVDPPPPPRGVAHGGVNCVSSIKRDVKKKTSTSTGGREDFCLEIQPTVVSVPPDSLERFCSGCLPSLWSSSADGDDANRVW